MFKKIIQLAKTLSPPEAFFVDRPNGYDLDLPDNILIFGRGGISPANGPGAIHHRYLLNLNLGTPCRLLLNGHRFLLEEGICFLIYPYENHLFIHSDEGIFRLMITFEVKRSDILPEPHSPVFLTAETTEIAWKLLRLYQSGKADRWELTLLLTLLLAKLKQATVPAEIANPWQGIASSQTGGIARHILSHLDAELNLNEIAARFHVSVSSMRRRFLADTGICLGEYIRRSRIMKAIYYLRQNEKNIGEIAEACGFHSIQAFSRAFREKMGKAPVAYRLSQTEKPGGRKR